MKRILPILFVLAFVQSYAQKSQQSLGTKHTMVVALSDFKVDSLLFLPERDTTFKPYKNGAVVLKQSDSSLYYYAQYWRPMGGAFVKTVYKRGDSLFYQRGGAEYFVAKWGLRAFTVPSGLTATQIGDSIAVTTVLNGLVIGNGSGFATATVDTPLYYSSGMLRIAKASNDSSGYLSYFDWRAFNAKVDPSREVNGVMSITGGGPLNQNRNLSLVNDQLAPPASYYYGTNTVGVKGWFALPEGGGTSPVTSVHGRIGDIVALQSDYSDYYSLLGHTHNGLAPLGGSAGQVLKKLSNNNYDYAWMDDLNDPGSSTGVFVDTIARVGNDLVWRKNFTDYTLEKVWNQYRAGNGLKLSNDTFSLKHITVTADSNILIGTQVNDGHKFYLKGQPRIDIGSDATGDTYYRDALGGMARLPKPIGLSKPVLGFDASGVKPYWKEDDGNVLDTTSLSNRINGKQNIADTSTVDATRYWVGQTYAPLNRTLTINGTTYDLNANRSWSIPSADSAIYATMYWVNGNFYSSLSQLSDTSYTINYGDGGADTVVIAPGGAGGSGGSGTVNSGAANSLAYYAITGTEVSPLAAITANRALISNANGLPTHSSVTNTELSYVSGVTSAIQTQLNGKQGALTLTTTGTSGAATLVGNTLNIPQYSVGSNYTDEQAQDAVGSMVSSEFTYTDATPSLAINAIAQSKVTNLTADLAAKQATLVSGTNIKTINGQSLLGSGDITISGGTGEANTASNIGNGTGVFAQKNSADLQFKSLKGGTNIGITATDTTVTISAPGDLVTFTPRFSGGIGQGDVNIVIPVGHLFTHLMGITAASNLTVGFSTSSTSGSQNLYHVIANTNTNPTYNWTYSATVKKADGTTVTTIPNGKTHTVFYIPTDAYWLLASEY